MHFYRFSVCCVWCVCLERSPPRSRCSRHAPICIPGRLLCFMRLAAVAARDRQHDRRDVRLSQSHLKTETGVGHYAQALVAEAHSASAIKGGVTIVHRKGSTMTKYRIVFASACFALVSLAAQAQGGGGGAGGGGGGGGGLNGGSATSSGSSDGGTAGGSMSNGQSMRSGSMSKEPMSKDKMSTGSRAKSKTSQDRMSTNSSASPSLPADSTGGKRMPDAK